MQLYSSRDKQLPWAFYITGSLCPYREGNYTDLITAINPPFPAPYREGDYTDLITMSADSHQEVIRFDVPVDEVFIVNVLNSSNHLQS